MISNLYVYLAPEGSYDPFRNLAREELFLELIDQKKLSRDSLVLYLWQNQNTVVIGRNQNAYKECRVALLEEEGGSLSRRLSGGGAVFHDLGNLNYTFIAHKDHYDIGLQTKVILEAVQSFRIPAEVSGRNDLTVCGKKFSGNAYYQTRGACYQHGTLLMRVDPEKMSRYLSVSREKLAAKGVASVRSRVIGLCEYADLSAASLKEALIQGAEKVYGIKAAFLSEERLEGERLSELQEKYQDPLWRYGQSRPYEYEVEKRLSVGQVQFQFQVEKGRIASLLVYSDALDTELPFAIQGALAGAFFSKEGIETALSEDKTLSSDLKEELRDMLLEAL